MSVEECRTEASSVHYSSSGTSSGQPRNEDRRTLTTDVREFRRADDVLELLRMTPSTDEEFRSVIVPTPSSSGATAEEIVESGISKSVEGVTVEESNTEDVDSVSKIEDKIIQSTQERGESQLLNEDLGKNCRTADS